MVRVVGEDRVLGGVDGDVVGVKVLVLVVVVCEGGVVCGCGGGG